jgi:hypothetical protein
VEPKREINDGEYQKSSAYKDGNRLRLSLQNGSGGPGQGTVRYGVSVTDENVIIGLDRADDAGVYRISDDLALIQTVDFFTPIVDDPYWFGQIAAANALSDVYAMGGTPKTAMNLVAFPVKTMDLSILRQIIQGGIDKLKEAEVVLIGGHSIEDKEIKYGLSVTGFHSPGASAGQEESEAGRPPGFDQSRWAPASSTPRSRRPWPQSSLHRK